MTRIGQLASALLVFSLPHIHAFVCHNNLASFQTPTAVQRAKALTMKEEPFTWEKLSFEVRKNGAKAVIGLSFLLGPAFTQSTPVHADADLKAQLEALNKQVLMRDKMLRMGKQQKIAAFPTVKNGLRIDAKEMKNSVERIQVLQAYLDEVENDIYQRQWRYVPGFLQVFAEQEDSFVRLVEGLYPTDSVADKSSRDALSYEAQNLFIELDNLREAAKFQRPRATESAYTKISLAYYRFLKQAAEKAYTKIALAYDRFLKAGDLYKGYDPVTSTEIFYNIPTLPKEAMIKYDSEAAVKVTDQIVVLGGPDKGKTGKLIGIDEQKGIIKLDTNGAFSEVKIIGLKDIGKQLQADT